MAEISSYHEFISWWVLKRKFSKFFLKFYLDSVIKKGSRHMLNKFSYYLTID